MKIKEVMSKLKVSRQMIASRIKSGEIKATWIANGHDHAYWDISQESLDEYLRRWNEV